MQTLTPVDAAVESAEPASSIATLECELQILRDVHALLRTLAARRDTVAHTLV